MDVRAAAPSPDDTPPPAGVVSDSQARAVPRAPTYAAATASDGTKSSRRASATPPPARLDDAAFAALFTECVADVHAYAISLLGERSAAEDVTALAFERLYRSRSRLDRGRGTPRAWLFAIARNAALDELRRRRRHPQGELREEIGGDRRAADALEDIARRASVRDALLALPLREREIVLLKFHGQLSNGELARALDISESNAGTRLHRALVHLREELAGLERQVVA
jgi:RNA polymerase sigma-70 factor (ECF subfamily)